MKYVDEFRNEEYVKALVKSLHSYEKKPFTLMEVCGTHTMAIFKYGIREILPENIRLISGPGCPVCVTPQSYIDAALELSKHDNVIITTFGDMMRVPGKSSSLLKRKAEGGDIRIVYSALDALNIAKENSGKKVIFLSVGFETTTPITAIAAMEAMKEGIDNVFFLLSHRIIPPAMELLVKDKDINIDGFLLPGHVSAIIGEKPYEFLSKEYNIPGVITGFEPSDILQGITSLLSMILNKDFKILNEYKRVVKSNGNVKASEYLKEVFTLSEGRWRGIGNIENSSYIFKKKYEAFDAVKHFNIDYVEYDGSPGCRCGEILKGKISPLQCPLYKKVCSPENPIGSCMVSSEGTCSAYYRYHSQEN